jgi:hypothetical protein
LADSVEKVENTAKTKFSQKLARRQISFEDAFFMRRRRSPKASVQVDVVHRV